MKHKVLAGLLSLLLIGCSSNPNTPQQTNTSTPTLDTSSAVKDGEGTSSSIPSPAEEPQPTPASITPASTSSASPARARRVPPPHEKWMDTMMSLVGVEPPNQAKMIEDEPSPLNLHSVEILIADRYKPEKPITLTIRAYVTESGTVSRVQVLRNSQPDMVPSYFLPPLRELRFQPAKENGKPIPTWTTFTLNIRPI